MYQLIDGEWRNDGFEPNTRDGEFDRSESTFRNWITADGSSGFRAEPDRYHLYVSLACPWAHRTLIVRKLKGLESIISVDVVEPHMGDEGWIFGTYPGSSADTANGCSALHEVYHRADPHFNGIVTVPVLWDKATRTIVNNESSEIIRMLNSAFNAWGNAELDLYPEAHREEIDTVNRRIYDDVNNGVYRAGFATTQGAYEQAARSLFDALDWLEARLATQRYLVGSGITEADWRLFTTLVRFDAVYHTHFKCNLHRLVDYPNLWAYTRELYQVPGIAETVNLDHIKQHYYTSHPTLNPARIVPIGPAADFTAPHDRSRLGCP